MNEIGFDSFANSTVAMMQATSKRSTFAGPPLPSSSGMDLAPPPFTGPPRAQPASSRRSATNSRRREFTEKSAAVGAKKSPARTNRRGGRSSNNPASEPQGLIRIPLDDDQLERLTPILAACQKANRFEGILCSLARAYSPARGMTVLELQVMRVDDQRTANAVWKLIRG
jgi:hypothetical protein